MSRGGCAPAIHAKQAALRIRNAQAAQRPPGEEFDATKSAELAEERQIVEPRTSHLVEPGLRERLSKPFAGVHAIEGRECVPFIATPEEALQHVVKVERHETRRDADGRPATWREYDSGGAGLGECGHCRSEFLGVLHVLDDHPHGDQVEHLARSEILDTRLDTFVHEMIAPHVVARIDSRHLPGPGDQLPCKRWIVREDVVAAADVEPAPPCPEMRRHDGLVDISRHVVASGEPASWRPAATFDRTILGHEGGEEVVG